MHSRNSQAATPDDHDRRTEHLLSAAADDARDALFVKDLAGRYLYCNAAAERFVGRLRTELVGRDDLELFGAEVAAAMQAHDRRVLASGIAEMEVRNAGSPGNERICEVTKSPYRDHDGTIIGVIGTAREVTESRRDRQWLLNRQAVLELIAQGAPPAEILDGLVRLIEEEIPGVAASCMLLDAEGKHLHVAAGRSLATEYVDAIQGLTIGANVGSCGTAAFRGETIITDDIASDPLWNDYREAALRHELRACVSVPILSRKIKPRSVLGTFAVYAHRPGPPHPKLLAAIADVEYLACIAVENNQIMRRLQAEEARFRTFAENTSDAFLLHGSDGAVLDANTQASAQLGYTLEELNGMLPTEFDPAVTPEGLHQILKKLKAGERLTFDSIHRRKDGTTFPVEVRLTPFYQGDELRTVAVVQDITARKEAERALRESEQRHQLAAENLDAILNALPAQIALLDATGVIKQVNGAWRSFAAANSLNLRDMGVGANYVELTRNAQGERSEEASAVARGISQVLAGELPEFRMEYPCDSPTQRAWYQLIVNPLIAGERSGAVVMHLDDSARKRAEAGRRLSEFAFDRLSVEAYLVSRDGRILKANKAACRNSGYSQAELMQLTVHDMDLNYPAEQWPAQWQLLKSERHLQFESQLRRKNGEAYPVEIDANFLEFEGSEYNYAFIRDITERKRAEAALKAGERRYRELADAIPQIVWTADASGSITQINAKVTEYTGTSANELTGWSWDRVIHPDDLAHTVRDWTMTVQSGVPRDIEFRIRRIDGTYRWHITRQVPARNDAGEITTWYGTCTDVEDLKQAQVAVRESEARFRNVLDFSPAVIYLKDLSFRYLFVNRTCAASQGVPQTEWIGKTAHDFFPKEIADQFTYHDRKVLETLRPHQLEESLVQPDGRRIELLSIQFPLFHADGRPYAICGISTDITDRKQAEAELFKAAELLRAVADGTSDSLFVKDLDGRYLFVNQAVARVAGKRIEEIIGKDDATLFDPQSAQFLAARDRRIRETGAVETEEETLTVSGTTRTFLATKAPYRDESGNIVGTIGIATDITKRKHAEQAIRESEERYRVLFESCGDAIYLVDFTGQIRSANPAAARMTRYSADKLSKMNIRELDSAADAEHIPERFDRLRAGETLHFELIQRCKDGTTCLVEIVATPMRIGEEPFILAFARDIGLRKDAERSLRLTQFSIDRAVDSIFWISPVGEILYVNEAACQTLGYTHEELIGKTVPEIDPNFPAEAWPAHWEEIKRRGSFTFESEHETKDGRMLQTEVTVNYLQHENREYNCAVMRDVTNRKQTERERDRLWNYSPDPLCIAGFDGKLRQVNPAWTKILGWSPDELLEQAWITFVHPDDREASLAAEQTLLRGEDLTGLENRYRCKNGEYRWFSWNAIPLPEQQTICAFVRDITRERTLAEQFRQAQKMEAIGRLAGGIAHDFNNLLTVINGYSSLLLGTIHDDARRKPLEVIHKAGERAATLTSQLLAFSRKAIVDLQVLDLNQVVESITAMLGRMIGEDVQLKLDLAPNLSHVAFDPGQLEQVLMNLAVNARDAMPDGGILTISTREAESPSNDRGKPSNLPPGRYVQLIVADDGLGMNDDVKAQIFEPFFTTKGVGIGTGLGLATVYGAVQQAGGVIAVESQPGRGTMFRIWLPAKGRPVSEIEEKLATAPPPGKETVLVVEDEHDVRGLVRFVLDMQGYRVLEADSGSSAIQAAAEFQGPIHLLLTDLVMNDLGGRELAEHIRSSRPDINVLYMSGYTEDEIVRRGVRDSRSEFLQKPFSPDALAEKVRQVLDAGPSNDR